MVCSNCGNGSDGGEKFCRKCGTDLVSALALPAKESLLPKNAVAGNLANSKDPDELTGNGIGSVIMGDGFLMVAVFLSATPSAVGSLLWLLLLIPAFFFFGKGFSDVLLARQIRRRWKQQALLAPSNALEASQPYASTAQIVQRHTAAALTTQPSVTEQTTRELR